MNNLDGALILPASHHSRHRVVERSKLKDNPSESRWSKDIETNYIPILVTLYFKIMVY